MYYAPPIRNFRAPLLTSLLSSCYRRGCCRRFLSSLPSVVIAVVDVVLNHHCRCHGFPLSLLSSVILLSSVVVFNLRMEANKTQAAGKFQKEMDILHLN